jgi:hypothetical protein
MRTLLALAISLILAVAAPAWAEERITQFVSGVTVNTDATLEVRETIDVQAEGVDIRRGIFRDFPTSYAGRAGQRVNVGFDVISVTRDGKPEPYALESLSNGMRVRIGDRDVFLTRGPHRYEIVYRTSRQIGFFENFDEIYWNVTGNGWQFPIDKARVRIALPAGASISDGAVYTGSYGSSGKDARVISATGNVFEAETTRRLAPEEGFTVAVAWQKGIVTPPAAGQKLGWWISDNAGYFALGLGLVVSCLYFLLAWLRVGRDPAKGTIIPLFAPPKGLGPACVRFLNQYGADDRGFAAALVGLAVKGCLKIADHDGDFSITKLPEKGGRDPLTTSEKALYNALPAHSIGLTQANQKIVAAAKSALKDALADEYEGTAFLRNLGWFAAGLGLSILFLAAAALLFANVVGIETLFPLAWLAIWWGMIVSFGWAALKGFIAARGLWRKISSLAGLLFLVPFVGAGVILPLSMFGSGGFPPALYVMAGGAALFGVINVIFYHLLPAPTESGQRLRDQIEGFRLYMTTAEEERLKVLHPPEKTPELFERYLPYALALDCENEWNAKFAAVLAAAAAAGAAGPIWYSGTHWNPGRSGDFTDSLGRGLAASTAAASATPPGRSSGSGGGGFSGGGGGGGGGGGW